MVIFFADGGWGWEKQKLQVIFSVLKLAITETETATVKATVTSSIRSFVDDAFPAWYFFYDEKCKEFAQIPLKKFIYFSIPDISN